MTVPEARRSSRPRLFMHVPPEFISSRPFVLRDAAAGLASSFSLPMYQPQNSLSMKAGGAWASSSERKWSPSSRSIEVGCCLIANGAAIGVAICDMLKLHCDGRMLLSAHGQFSSAGTERSDRDFRVSAGARPFDDEPCLCH